jgi:hypothetical protein
MTVSLPLMCSNVFDCAAAAGNELKKVKVVTTLFFTCKLIISGEYILFASDYGSYFTFILDLYTDQCIVNFSSKNNFEI